MTTLVLIGLVVVAAAVLWVLWQIARAATSPVGAGLIVASGTVVAALIAAILAKDRDRKIQIEQEHRTQKVEIYDGFIDLWFQLAFSEKTGSEQLTEEEQIEFLLTFSKKMIIWGNVAIVKKWGQLRAALSSGESPLTMMWDIEDLLFLMRADLGHNDRELKRGGLLRLFINDIDDYLPTSTGRNAESANARSRRNSANGKAQVRGE